MSPRDKPLVWLKGDVKSPPFTDAARREAGFLLRMLQRGENVVMPHARPIPIIGARCCELRINDVGLTWRIVCRVDADAIVIVAVFEKKTRATPKPIIATCKDRLKRYDEL